MLGSLFSRIFGGAAAPRSDGAPESKAEIEELIADLAQRLPEDARAELRTEAHLVREARPQDRAATLATLVCRAEDQLALAAEDPYGFRIQFRTEIAQRWPGLVALDGMVIVLLPPDRQEDALCRTFLRSTLALARGVVGAAGGDKLREVQTWLDDGLDRGEPVPFAAARGRPTNHSIIALQTACHALYDWLRSVLGQRADATFEEAYRRISRQFGATEGFPVILAMVPDRLLTADKIGLLRRNQIEHMLRDRNAALERANAEIQDARDTLEQRVRERTRELQAANEELAKSMTALAEAKAQAEQANRTKSEFLANVSHELRTPLNAILGFSQVMMDENLKHIAAERFPDYSRHIYDSGSHLLNIINEILDIAKLEAGRTELTEEVIEVPELIEHCVTASGLRLDGSGLAVERAIADGLPPLRADRRMLVQILLNLLSNAMKFTPSGGTVRIEARRNDTGGLDIAVHDSGVGIAEQDIPLVLEPFRQVRSAYHGESGGTGLGLPLVVGMTKLHGGEFLLSSKLGRGTSALVRLPAHRLLDLSDGAAAS
ncbi:MAG: HAMP domain-containing histidine kinase [Alphaproteobacteria bacterium]|nr:HAMP domain-containing histidine kinase [Alphaproteobacteria bacterium]